MRVNKQDLEYQPKEKEYSFVNRRLKLKHRIKALLIIAGLILIIVIPSTAALLLNYFRIIYLGNISKAFENLPRSPYELSDIIENYRQKQQITDFASLGDNRFSAGGKITELSEDFVKLKLYSGKSLKLELSVETNIVQISKDGTQQQFLFTFELLQKENIGKQADVVFRKEGGKFVLENIELE